MVLPWQQRNSFLLNKLNEKVVADKMTLMDEPHLVQASGAVISTVKELRLNVGLFLRMVY